MLATTQGPRRLGAALLAAVMAVVVAACGGSTATSSAPAAAVGRRAEPARAGGLGARPANRRRPAPPATPARP